MNEFRKSLVHKAFKKLDANKNGVIQLDDIKLFYNAKLNPQVCLQGLHQLHLHLLVTSSRLSVERRLRMKYC